MSKLNVPKLQLLPAVSHEIECMSLMAIGTGRGAPAEPGGDGDCGSCCIVLGVTHVTSFCPQDSKYSAYPQNPAGNLSKIQKNGNTKRLFFLTRFFHTLIMA